ncbi:hypothetical protein Scep_004170 [Stephania cephalantha]|uniref:Uncharacterized protein n=1 Tax=Stephania cephalantha TaxID=152367 RepID=A0AAP0KRY2_9MAGN
MDFDSILKKQQTLDTMRGRRSKICKLALQALIVVNPKSNFDLVVSMSALPFLLMFFL